MTILKNPYRESDKTLETGINVPFPSVDGERVMGLLAQCPKHAPTPLRRVDELAKLAKAGGFFVKDERTRMGLGSFKATGAAYAIASHAAEAANGSPMETALAGRTYVTASAGNHGMSVAAGARLFGARSVIYLSKTVPAEFADRLRALGGEVRIKGDNYEASMAAALSAADREGMILASDSSWPGYTQFPHRLMEGYLALACEVVEQMATPPSHIFLQAGVGGLAGALSAYFRKVWGDAPCIIVVEPDRAPALIESIRHGEAVATQGAVSNMGRLDCKEPSLIALKGLARDADFFTTISDEAAQAMTDRLAAIIHEGGTLESTPSGVAGIAAALNPAIAGATGMDGNSIILTVMSEAAG